MAIVTMKRMAVLVAAMAFVMSGAVGHIVTPIVLGKGKSRKTLKNRGNQNRLKMQGGEEYSLPAQVAGGCGHGHEKLNGHVDIMKRTANACGIFDMSWAVNEKAGFIDITMHSRGVGWLAMGIRGTTGKILDTATASVHDGKLTLLDGTTPGLVQPKTDPVHNLKPLFWKQDETGTTVKFRKPLRSPDNKKDVHILRKNTYLVGWSLHRTVDDVNRVHQFRGLFEINFFSDKRHYTPEIAQHPGVHDAHGNCLKCPCDKAGKRVVARLGVGGRRLLTTEEAAQSAKEKHGSNPMFEYLSEEQWAQLEPDYEATADPALYARAGARRSLSFHSLAAFNQPVDENAVANDPEDIEDDEEDDSDADSVSVRSMAVQWRRRRRKAPPPPPPKKPAPKPRKHCPRCTLCKKEHVIPAPKNPTTQCGDSSFKTNGLPLVPQGAKIAINIEMPGRTLQRAAGRRLLMDDDTSDYIEEESPIVTLQAVEEDAVSDSNTDEHDVDDEDDDTDAPSLMKSQFLFRRRRRRPKPKPPPPPNCPCGHSMVPIGGRRLLATDSMKAVSDNEEVSDTDSTHMSIFGWGGRRRSAPKPPTHKAECNCCPCLCMCGPSSEAGKPIPGSKCKTCACRSCDQEPYPPTTNKQEPPGTIDVRMRCGNKESLAGNKMASAKSLKRWATPVNKGSKIITVDVPASEFGKNGNSLTEATCSISTTYSTNKNSVCTDIRVKRPHPYPACNLLVKGGFCPKASHFANPAKQDPTKDSGHCKSKTCVLADCCLEKQKCARGMCPPPKLAPKKELRGDHCAGPKCKVNECCVQLFPDHPVPNDTIPDPNAKTCAGYSGCRSPEVLVDNASTIQCATKECSKSTCCHRRAIIVNTPTPTHTTPTPIKAPTPTTMAPKKMCSTFSCNGVLKSNAAKIQCPKGNCSEKTCCNAGGDFSRAGFKLQWEIVGGTITFTASANTAGWFAVGFGAIHTTMDTYQMVVNGASAAITDGWSTLYERPSGGGAGIAKVIRASSAGGRSSVTWSRPLKAGGKHTSFAKGKAITVSWAGCTSKSLGKQHDMTGAQLIGSAPIVLWE